jgi:hypothetical protein
MSSRLAGLPRETLSQKEGWGMGMLLSGRAVCMCKALGLILNTRGKNGPRKIFLKLENPANSSSKDPDV